MRVDPLPHQALHNTFDKPSPIELKAHAEIVNSKDKLRNYLASLKYFDLTGSVKIQEAAKNAHGGYCDVYVGHYLQPNTGNLLKVAIKRLRVHILSDRDFAKMLTREIRVWSRLNHPNILPFVGYALESNDCPLLISEWMEDGTINKYVKSHPDCDISQIVYGIAEGLSYLHSKHVIHGDMKADNVLVSSVGQPQICDFGISRLVSQSETLRRSTSNSRGLQGSLRWMAPEFFEFFFSEDDGPEPEHTEVTDVWAFGMTILELLTGEMPYAHIKHEAKVMHSVAKWNLPAIPEERLSFPPRIQCLWSICEECWQASDKRPNMRQICRILRANGPIEYKTLKPFIIKNNLFRQISVRYFERQSSQPCKTEVVEGFRHRLLELDIGEQANLLNFTDGWGEYTLDTSCTYLAALDEQTCGENGEPLKKPLKFVVHMGDAHSASTVQSSGISYRVGDFESASNFGTKGHRRPTCINELWILNTSTQIVSITDYGNQIMVDLLPAQSYSNTYDVGTIYNLCFICNGIIKAKTYHSDIRRSAMYIDIREVFDGVNIGLPLRKVPVTEFDMCKVVFENKGPQIIAVKQTELEMQVDLEPSREIHLELIWGRIYCFTSVCHEASVEHWYQFTQATSIDISRDFKETANILSDEYILSSSMCDEVTFYNPGLLVVSVEQCGLSVKCDLMPGMTKALTLHYEKDREYLFTFKHKGLISIQSCKISPGLIIDVQSIYMTGNLVFGYAGTRERNSFDINYIEPLSYYPQQYLGN